MIDSLEYYHNRDDHGNLRTQGEPEPLDEPFDELYDPLKDDPEYRVPDDLYDDLPIEDEDDFDSGRTDEELEEN